MDTLLIDRRTSRRHSRLQRASGPKLDCTYVRSIDRLNTAATASGAAICTECRSPVLLQFRGSNLFSLPPFGDTRSSSFRSSPGRMPITSPASAVIHSDGQDRPAARRRRSLSYSLSDGFPMSTCLDRDASREIRRKERQSLSASSRSRIVLQRARRLFLLSSSSPHFPARAEHRNNSIPVPRSHRHADHARSAESGRFGALTLRSLTPTATRNVARGARAPGVLRPRILK